MCYNEISEEAIMKFIHCADIHLDSKMETNLSSQKAKERKKEILNTFERMVAYAVENKECFCYLFKRCKFFSKNKLYLFCNFIQKSEKYVIM